MNSEKIKGILVAVLFGFIAIWPHRMIGYQYGLKFGLFFAAIILFIGFGFIFLFKRSKLEFFQTYKISNIIVFGLIALVTSLQSPYRPYPVRDVVNIPPTDSHADFGLVTKKFAVPQPLFQLAFSPDGKKVAYQKLYPGKESSGLYVLDEAGEHEVKESRVPVHYLGFSRDSKHLAYIVREPIDKMIGKKYGNMQNSIVIDGIVQGWEKGELLNNLGPEYTKGNQFTYVRSAACPNIKLEEIQPSGQFFYGPVYILNINGYKSRFLTSVGHMITSKNCDAVALVMDVVGRGSKSYQSVVLVGTKNGKFTDGKIMDGRHSQTEGIVQGPQFSADGKYVQYAGTTDEGTNAWWIVEKVQ